MITLGRRFSLNSIILVNGDYIKGNNIENKLVYNIKTKEILYCDRSADP